ncbi:hypothetical protein KEM54_004546 [Ascosphaera aggregata]|nr:hypothetical protein KEM54_004546 [Ascosphaera aggregata]
MSSQLLLKVSSADQQAQNYRSVTPQPPTLGQCDMASPMQQCPRTSAQEDERPRSDLPLPISMPSTGSNSIHSRRRLSNSEDVRGDNGGDIENTNGAGLDCEAERDNDDSHDAYTGDADTTSNDDDDDDTAVDRDELPNYAWYLPGNQMTNTRQPSALDSLHPFVQLLSLADLDDCVQVEEAFPPHERCSREKMRYRLTRCPELSLGVFSLPPKSEWVDGQRPERAILVAHIIATRTTSLVVTDNSMELPKNWENNSSLSSPLVPAIGHEEGGSTIALHSLAVLQKHQGKKLGSMLMKSYVQRIKEAATAKRIALLAHDHLLSFYESFGFQNKGKSACQFGGGGWYDMVLEFSEDTDSENSSPL